LSVVAAVRTDDCGFTVSRSSGVMVPFWGTSPVRRLFLSVYHCFEMLHQSANARFESSQAVQLRIHGKRTPGRQGGIPEIFS